MQATFLEFCGPQKAQYGLVWATGEHDIVFHSENGRTVGRNPIWVQGTLETLVHMFERFGL